MLHLVIASVNIMLAYHQRTYENVVVVVVVVVVVIAVAIAVVIVIAVAIAVAICWFVRVDQNQNSSITYLIVCWLLLSSPLFYFF